MMAISSFRRLSDSDEVATNQLRAKDSWEGVFDSILYFGEYEPLLSSPKTEFIDCGDFPFISSLVRAAGMAEDYVCLLNADIVVAPSLENIIREVYGLGARAVVSKRWTFEGEDYRQSEETDQGIDFFGAEPVMWARMAPAVPERYRIAANCWDTWVMSWFNYTYPRQFYEISSRRVIFHPKHLERKRLYAIEPHDDIYTQHCGWPVLKL